MARRGDQKTLDLFAVPRPVEATAGSLDMDRELRQLLADCLSESRRNGKDRFAVAAEMSRMLDADITKWMLDAWTAESKDGHRFPLAYLPAFEASCDTHAITIWLSGLRGCELLIGDEILEAKLGRLQKEYDATGAKIRLLKKHIGGGR